MDRTASLRPLAAAALPVLALAVSLGSSVLVLASAGDTLGYDYQAYLRAAERLLAGQPLYDPSVDVAGPFGIFYYPPPYAVLVVPFTLLPAELGPWVWAALLYGAFVAGAALMPVRREVRWLTLLLAGLSWPFVYSLKLGQVGPLLFLTFAAGWRWLDRPGPLGASIALGTIVKVQPAALFGWAIATRRWRAAAIGLAVVAGAAIGATLLVGPPTWADYVAILARVSDPITTPRNFTPGAILYQLGVPADLATTFQWVSLALVVAVTVWAWFRVEAERAYVVTVVASQLVSPLLWDHYAVLLLLPVAYLLERRRWWAVAILLLTAWPLVGITPAAAYPLIFAAGLLGPLTVTWTTRPGAAGRT